MHLHTSFQATEEHCFRSEYPFRTIQKEGLAFFDNPSDIAWRSMRTLRRRSVDPMQFLRRYPIKPVNCPCDSDLPIGLCFFQDYEGEAEYRNDPTVFVGTAFRTIYVFDRDDDAMDITQMIECEADSTFSKLSDLAHDYIRFRTHFNGDHRSSQGSPHPSGEPVELGCSTNRRPRMGSNMCDWQLDFLEATAKFEEQAILRPTPDTEGLGTIFTQPEISTRYATDGESFFTAYYTPFWRYIQFQ